MISAAEALNKLKTGNKKYLTSPAPSGDISLSIRKYTAERGQSPYAVIITCSDSRVIPESIFSAGIGELFVVRVAGNVIDPHQLGSIEYAVEHLGTPLVVVLGHTGCGAVSAAIEGHASGFIKSITDKIKLAVVEEKDTYRASCLNVQSGVAEIEKCLGIKAVGAIYHIEDGRVEFISE